jgi:hypothetical protein
MKEPKYCKKCVLQEGYSTVVFDEDGICSDCRGGYSQRLSAQITRLLRKLDAFESYLNSSKSDGPYDCLLMLSGGKDSTYMLHQLVNKQKRRPLAYTVYLPFESREALHNIEQAIQRLNVEHIGFTPDATAYKALMKHIFDMKPEDIAAVANNGAPEKSPCLVCSTYMILLAAVFAYRMGIPYILYCADPSQMLMNSDQVEKLIEIFYDFCGRELVHRLFGSQLDDLKENKYGDLPEIVFPYVKSHYDANQIIAELKELKLYNSDPLGTHCTMFGIINYFAITRFNRPLYVVETAIEVRKGTLDREIVIGNIEEYKQCFFKVAHRYHISHGEKAKLEEIIRSMSGCTAGAEYICNNILSLPQMAEELGIELVDRPAALPGDASTAMYVDEKGDFDF